MSTSATLCGMFHSPMTLYGKAPTGSTYNPPPTRRSLSSCIGELSLLLSRACFPDFSFPISIVFFLSICFSPFSPFFFNCSPISSSPSFFFVSSSELPILVSDLSSQAASLLCSTEIRHFPPPSYFIFIYWLIVLVLYHPSSSGFYCPLFPILIYLMSPGPALGSLLRSSHELRLFYRPIVFVVYLFISYIFYLLSFFLLSLCSRRWFPQFYFPAPLRKFFLPERLSSK
jgi:hypothetical protein